MQVDEVDETQRDDIITLKELENCLRPTIARVNKTRQPTYVAVHGQRGVAILDLEEYREMARLAQRGLIAELAEQISCDEAEGALVTWEVVDQDLRQLVEERGRKEHG